MNLKRLLSVALLTALPVGPATAQEPRRWIVLDEDVATTFAASLAIVDDVEQLDSAFIVTEFAAGRALARLDASVEELLHSHTGFRHVHPVARRRSERTTPPTTALPDRFVIDQQTHVRPALPRVDRPIVATIRTLRTSVVATIRARRDSAEAAVGRLRRRPRRLLGRDVPSLGGRIQSLPPSAGRSSQTRSSSSAAILIRLTAVTPPWRLAPTTTRRGSRWSRRCFVWCWRAGSGRGERCSSWPMPPRRLGCAGRARLPGPIVTPARM